MQDGVMTRLSDPDLRAYVVWVPMFRGAERDVPTATTVFPDARSKHYWDGGSLLVSGYRDTLKFDEPAWDIFLLYGPEARWDGDRPPAPDFWMHQLGSRSKPRVPGPFLDAAVFLERAKAIAN
jgi:hypothetical protein